MVSKKESIQALLNLHNQDQLLKYFDELTSEQQLELLNKIEQLDVERANSIYQKFGRHISEIPDSNLIKPIAADHTGCYAELSKDQLAATFDVGLKAISNNEVAVIVLAGGQATRLGSAEPKGIISLNLLRLPNSLLALQAAQIVKLQFLAKEKYPDTTPEILWLIMCSPSTRAATEKHFEQIILPSLPQLKKEQIIFFNQGVLPCFDNRGRFMLSKKDSPAMAPDGNGGLYIALKPYLPHLHKRKVKYVHVYCVDNILCRVADPVFLGYAIRSNADCAAKVVTKTEPNEAVGVVCLVDGVPKVVEYSEITSELAAMNDVIEPNKLALRAGNIANHFFTTQFLDTICDTELPFHVANKKIACVDFDSGQLMTPKQPNGVKMEQFVFDVFQYSRNFHLWEVPRDDEFAPLKNNDAVGVDCPSTSVRALHATHAKWLMNAGAKIANNQVIVEIDPLLTYDGEGLEKFNGKVFASNTLITE